MSKLTKELFGRLIVGAGCCFWRTKQSKMLRSSMKTDTRHPSVRGFSRYTFESRGAFYPFSCVARVLSPSRFAQIISAIIKRIVVFVIGKFSTTATENQTVHLNSSLLWQVSSPSSVETADFWIPSCNPVPLRKPVEISGINDCDLVFCERNVAIRLVKRLNHFCARHLSPSIGASFGMFHRSSLQGLLKFSRYSTILFALLYGALPAFPQNPSVIQPNCQFGFTFTTATRSSQFQNIAPAGVPTRSCTSWTVVYSVTGFSAVSLEIDSAPDAGATPGASPGSWAIWPTANIAAGQTLPLTTTSCTITNPCAITVFGFAPWVSVNLNSVTGTGTVSGTAYGWQVQGSQESNTGATQSQGVSAVGQPAAGNPVIDGVQDTAGNTQRVRPSCETPAALLQTSNIALSGTTTTQFIALAAGKAIHVCSMSVGNGGGTTPTFSLQYGTGTNCATGLTTLIPNTVIPASTAAPQQWTGHVIVPSGNAACYILTGTTPTGNLTVTFAQQ